MNDMMNLINNKYDKSGICWHAAKHPIFDNHNMLTKALIVVGLGCDVFDGIAGMTPPAMEKELEKIKTKYPNNDDVMISNEL